MPNKPDTKLQSMYCNLMKDIKNRANLVYSIVHRERTLGIEFYDYEVIALNIRKILESIAYSSMVASKKKYAQAHSKFEKHYKAKQILEELEKLHPQFYPRPALIEEKDEGKQLMYKEDLRETLSREDFVELYDKCSEVLHVWNPFKDKPRHVDFRLSPDDWMKRIANLLSTHVTIPADTEELWLCVLSSAEDKQPHVYTLEPTPP